MSISTGGAPLADDAIQRVLFVCHPVHVYAIPPLMSMKGYTAGDWTTPDPSNGGKTRQIFTARLRIVETAVPAGEQEKVTADILLEDPSDGSLFAAAPYTDEGAVEHAVDSSRFFALRVVGDGGMKAVLGIGFEDRSEAFDFGVTLQEARKVLGFNKKPAPTSDNVPPAPMNPRLPPRGIPAGGPRGVPTRGPPGRTIGGNAAGRPSPQRQTSAETPAKPKDFSLKPGQTINVDIGGRRPAASSPGWAKGTSTTRDDEEKAFFSIAPPPGPGACRSNEDDSPGAFSLIPPPPSAREARSDRRRKPPENPVQGRSAFDDDEDFGEFQ